MANVLTVLEERDGVLRGASLEAVSAGARLAGELGVSGHGLLLCGPEAGGDVVRATQAGASSVRVGEHPDLADPSPELLARIVAEEIRKGGYQAVLFPATVRGKDLAPRVAALLDVSLASDVTEVGVDGTSIFAVRPIYAGKVFARVSFQATPAVLSLRPNIFTVSEGGSGEVETFTPAIPQEEVAAGEVLEFVQAGEGSMDVAEATTVVSGGRGMRGPEEWGILEELRDALGPQAALGASRAVVDAGWRSHGEQVGQTGKTVAPRLYVAVGISGAIQHLAGMRTSGVIVAVNRDADAPIFQVADYGIVGDLFDVVPRLTQEIRDLKAGD
ncbi:MAG: electron transfer flavoprotein subunit alpha/FixB family protein [Gemmatimonadota bacterium]